MTPFEQACSDIAAPDNNSENVIESTGCDDLAVDFQNGAKLCTVSVSRKKIISYLEKCAEQYPDEVQIIYRNANGSIVAYMPLSYLKIRRPTSRSLSAEQKETLRQRAYNNFNTDKLS